MPQSRRSGVSIVGACILGLASHAFSDVINVPGDAATIQEAIDLAIDGDEVIVADGVYTGEGNVNVDFVEKAITVRSANGPMSCAVDGGGAGGNRGFIFANGEGASSRLEGFTIRNCTSGDGGGGVYAIGAGPTIINCRFVVCSAPDANGGGMATSGAATLIEGCMFIDNSARNGAGLWIEGAGNVVRDSTFESNTADRTGGGAAGCAEFLRCRFANNAVVAEPYVSFFGGGGAIAGSSGPVVVEDCTFEANSVTAPDVAAGGAISVFNGSDVEAVRCTFDGNEVVATSPRSNEALGGAIEILGGRSTIHGCSFVGNRVDGRTALGPAIRHDGIDFEAVNCTVALNFAEPVDDAPSVDVSTQNSPVLVANCVMHGVLACGLRTSPDDGDPEVRYSSLDCVTPGAGNIFGDPMIAADGHLLPGSPCIDAGSNADVPSVLVTDLDGEARFQDDPATPDTGAGMAPIVDMGADEFTAGATCAEDVDGDGAAGFGDVLAILAAWGPCDGCPEDVNGDGMAGFADILAVLAAWGPCPGAAS